MMYFTQDEFDSPDLKGSGSEMDAELLDKLNATRHTAGIPFVITSGYRTKAHNKTVGGVNGSSHTKGLAVDIKCKSGTDRSKIIRAALKNGFTRIGISNNFIHLDVDEDKVQNVIWTY
jgi:uncharacterized protein YcbK (DUF882 family)